MSLVEPPRPTPWAWQLIAGIAIVVFSAAVCGLLAAMFDSSAGEIAVTLATIIGGAAALGAGVLAYLGVKKQIDEAGAIERERRRREEIAARAALPMALAEILDYCRSCCGTINRLLELLPDYTTSMDGVPSRADLPSLPAATATALQSAMRVAEEPNVTQLSQVLIFAQIQRSRLDDIVAGERSSLVVTRMTLLARICDAVKLHFFASRIFAYARGMVPATADSLSLGNSAFACGIMVEDIEGLPALMARREELLATDPFA